MIWQLTKRDDKSPCYYALDPLYPQSLLPAVPGDAAEEGGKGGGHSPPQADSIAVLVPEALAGVDPSTGTRGGRMDAGQGGGCANHSGSNLQPAHCRLPRGLMGLGTLWGEGRGETRDWVALESHAPAAGVSAWQLAHEKKRPNRIDTKGPCVRWAVSQKDNFKKTLRLHRCMQPHP